jgi:hypothetical protein
VVSLDATLQPMASAGQRQGPITYTTPFLGTLLPFPGRLAIARAQSFKLDPGEAQGLGLSRGWSSCHSKGIANVPKRCVRESRRSGKRHATHITMLAEKFMQDDVGNVVAAVVDAAVKGDMAAAKIILDRIAPARRGRPVSFELPRIETPADIANALGAVAGAMAEGELTPDEAGAVAGVIEASAAQSRQSSMKKGSKS